MKLQNILCPIAFLDAFPDLENFDLVNPAFEVGD